MSTATAERKYIIDPEFQSLLPALTEEERAVLEASVVKDGIRDKGVAWEDPDGNLVLLDGHNRYELAEKHALEFKAVRLKFPDRDAAIQWIINNQLGRRNLTDERRDYFIGKEYLLRVKKGESVPTDETFPLSGEEGDSADSRGLPREGEEIQTEVVSVPGKRLSEVMAEKHGISEKQVRLNALFAEGVDRLSDGDVAKREEILSGESEFTKGEIVAKAIPKRKKKKAKSGAVVYDWKAMSKLLGQVVREVDKISEKYGDRGNQYRSIRKQVNEIVDELIGSRGEKQQPSWRQKLIAKGKEQEKPKEKDKPAKDKAETPAE